MSFAPAAGGCFITFEGPEGGGKSTQVLRLAERLGAAGHAVTVTREPGGTAAGEAIREVLLNPSGGALLPATEALLFCAARAELVENVIRPNLASGHVVLCDRYTDSTLAYQGYGRGLDLTMLATLNRLATGDLVPDVTLLLDLPADVGLARRRREGDWNRIDAASLAFHERVRAGFLALAAAEPQRWHVVAADRPFDTVAEELWSIVAGRVARLTLDAVG
jgi:dTMP kinase